MNTYNLDVYNIDSEFIGNTNPSSNNGTIEYLTTSIISIETDTTIIPASNTNTLYTLANPSFGFIKYITSYKLIPITILVSGNTIVLNSVNNRLALLYDTVRWNIISNNTYTPILQLTKLVGTGSIGTTLQGSSVSLSGNGSVLAIGGPIDNTNAGAVWVYKRNIVTNDWVQQIKLANTEISGQEGVSVSLSDNGKLLAVGIPFLDLPGLVRIYTESNDNIWTVQAELLENTAVALGNSVSLSADGNTLAVGAPDFGIGATWVFTRNGTTWSSGTELIGTGGISPNQGFAVSLSADGNTLAVGAPEDNSEIGATWIFEKVNGVWTQISKLIGSGSIGEPRQGASVSLSGDGHVLAVGGTFDNSSIGAVWVFIKNGNIWSQQDKLIGTGNEGDESTQGSGVSLSGDGNLLAVGGQGDNNGIGATWLYKRNDNGLWEQYGDKLIGSGSIGESHQGTSVSLSADGNALAIGGTTDNTVIGATWVFI